VTSIEAAIMLEMKQPFQVALSPGSQTFAVGLGQGAEDSPALVLKPIHSAAPKLNYQQVAYGIAAWDGSTTDYLFYFRRFVDGSLPLDVRWLNGYRLLEWHFVGHRAGLAKSSRWRTFVEEFREQLNPLLRPKQTRVGLLEEARALAAHAGLDHRSENERLRDRRNAMEKTFKILQLMVTRVLNEIPSVARYVKFEAEHREQ
jgi:hypothetical protein